ncbi:MAG: SufE family protein [Gammaproteobacteria bacterium]|nr:SufE family protein [Gammaproteobacteria bacterium]
MSTIDDIQNEIIEEFEFFDQWMDKYEYIIDLGKKLAPLNDQFKHDDNLIPGCQSRVWLHAEMENDQVKFTADSDAVITKGIIALLIRVLSNQTAEQISRSELYFIDRIGLKEHLSPTRSNGLVSMVIKIKAIADNLKRYH